ncbi:MAG: DUF4169 family protein [Myxococcales bacterium]|nr:DUF4169 family protein [Myxococcales bacterium]MCB9718127.1 DUF4169 family protein [Myxococcales bacterium]
MGDVINLGRVRKRKQREAQQRQADANALHFGRSKADRLRERLEWAHQQAILDGARRETEDDEPDASPER